MPIAPACLLRRCVKQLGCAVEHYHVGVRTSFFTIPRLMVVALHQECAFCVAMPAAGRSNLYAGGHSSRSRAIITTSWKASPLRADSRSSPSCTAAVEG